MRMCVRLSRIHHCCIHASVQRCCCVSASAVRVTCVCSLASAASATSTVAAYVASVCVASSLSVAEEGDDAETDAEEEKGRTLSTPAREYEEDLLCRRCTDATEPLRIHGVAKAEARNFSEATESEERRKKR